MTGILLRGPPTPMKPRLYGGFWGCQAGSGMPRNRIDIRGRQKATIPPQHGQNRRPQQPHWLNWCNVKRILVTSLAIVFFAATTACAESNLIRFPLAAPISRLCPQEWQQLDTHFPDDTSYYKEKSIKVEWVTAIAQAKPRHRLQLLRPMLSVTFVHDLNKSLRSLMHVENHTQEHFKRTQLQLDLMNCLKVPVEQHDATIALYRQEAPSIDTAEIARILKLSKTPYCLNLVQEFQTYVTLNPTADSHYLDYMKLLSEPAEECLS